jgi:hypothetical protein
MEPKTPKPSPIDKFVKEAFESAEHMHAALNVLSTGSAPLVLALAKSWKIELTSREAEELLQKYYENRYVPMKVAGT